MNAEPGKLKEYNKLPVQRKQPTAKELMINLNE